MGYNWAKRKMKKTLFTLLLLGGLGTAALAQNNCPTGYKEVPGSNNNHTGKVVTKSNCTTTTTTENSGQNGVNVGVKAGVNAGYNRSGSTTTTTTEKQQCTPEKTYYYKCEEKKDKDKK